MRLLVLALAIVLAGCAEPGFGVSYAATEPGPGAHAPYGGDGTIDMVVAYFSFELRGDGDVPGGDMGAHCGFDDWTLSPPTALVHIGDSPAPDGVVMREIHPDQSTDGIGHFGTAPSALWRDGHDAIGRAFDHEEDLGEVTFHGDSASFEGVPVPSDRWLLADFTYGFEFGDDTWQAKETLHMRYFDDVPVELDRRELMCA